MKLLFKGGTVVSGDGMKKLDLLVKGEKILAAGEDLEFRDAGSWTSAASSSSRDLSMRIPTWRWK